MKIILQLFEFLFGVRIINLYSVLWFMGSKGIQNTYHLLLASWIKSYTENSERGRWGNGFRPARTVTAVMSVNPPRKRTKNKSYRKFAGLKRFLRSVRSKTIGDFIFLGQWWGVSFLVLQTNLDKLIFFGVFFHLYFISVVNQSRQRLGSWNGHCTQNWGKSVCNILWKNAFNSLLIQW